jgi:hypothetical protein
MVFLRSLWSVTEQALPPESTAAAIYPQPMMNRGWGNVFTGRPNELLRGMSQGRLLQALHVVCKLVSFRSRIRQVQERPSCNFSH